MFVICAHKKCRKDLRFTPKWRAASDIVFSSNENILHCAIWIDVVSERFEMWFVFRCAWKGSLAVMEADECSSQNH